MLERKILHLSNEFKDVLDELERSRAHFFITGRAGTGKSTLLTVFRNTSRKKIAILAPTGIAALNIKGQTIHSFFGFPPKMISPGEIRKKPNHRLYKNVDTIIIDEISMVRADVMDNIDRFLKVNRGSSLPFGGVQMIFFGDMFQLPPVVSSPEEKAYFSEYYQSPYFFSSKIIHSLTELTMIELTQVYRQKETHFINLLDRIRLKEWDEDDLITINERFALAGEEEDLIISLCSTNSAAQRINDQKLSEIQAPVYSYEAKVSGEFSPSVYPTDARLQLKLGAQVMFIKNDPTKRFVNGSLGKITYIDRDSVHVSLKNDHGIEQEIDLEVVDWEVLKYKIDPEKPHEIKTETVGVFTQLPIKLAWAITIHKSQGKTFDQVIIDLGRGAFEFGQTYVALSRCKSLDGIFLKQPLKVSDVMVDSRINEYYDFMRRL